MQYAEDKRRFSELLSKFTGINETNIIDYLKENTVKSLIENPTVIKTTQDQIQKLSELKELRNITDNLKKHDKHYTLRASNESQEYFQDYMKDFHDKEQFVCSFLDSGNRVISTKVMSRGTVNESPVFPREIVKEAILKNARSVILAHNHPGGSLRPSQADLNITRKMVEALYAVDVKCIDHIIVAGNKSVSLAEMGEVPEPTKCNSTVRERNCKYSIKSRINAAKENVLRVNNKSKKDATFTIGTR
ncbi:MAG: DNA repair protein [Clostridiaceae bacterium]|nr:DNA repair protein [Clostridiaceae bacterium]